MIGHIDILYSGQISGTTITGESISVSSVTVNNIISSGNTFSKFNLLSATTLSATTIQSAGLVGGGTQMVIANSDGVLSVQAIPVVGQSTVIRNGLNTYTAGTTADYSVNISALTINTLTASGNSVFTGTLSGGSLFSASTIFSGTSNLDTLFITQNQLANSQTFVQPGTNTYTGGTSTRPTVNVSALTISTLTASGNSVFTGTLSGGSSFSANTLFSGTTNLYSIFFPIGGGSGEINTASNLGLGTGIFTQKSGFDLQFKSLSAGTNISLSNDSNTIVITSTGGPAGSTTYIQPGLNTYTGGTSTNPTVNVSALTINTLISSGNSVFTGTLSGGSSFSANTIFSGTTDLSNLFLTTAQTFSSQFTNVQSGLNTYTGGTASNPTVNISALTINTITASGNSIFTGTLSGGSSFSANTIFSGTSNVNSLFSTIDHTHFGGIGFTIDAGNSVISTGYKGCVIIPFNATIRSWTIVADTTGSIVVDVWKDTYGNYPPVSGDTISGTEKITLSNQQKNQDLLLTSWATSISSGDILAFNVESVASVKKVYVMISVLKN
jgi:hypothetical protein